MFKALLNKELLAPIFIGPEAYLTPENGIFSAISGLFEAIFSR